MAKQIIKYRYTDEIMFKGEAESLKQYVEFLVRDRKNLDGAYLDGAYLRGANLGGANLEGAYLRGAYLGGAKNYSCNHVIFQELVRRQPIDLFTDSEWSLIGKLMTHRWCWGDLKPHKETLKPILTKLSDIGFGEFLVTMKEKYQ